MPVSNVEDNLSKRERELVAENRILKTRLARLERNPALAQREQIEHSSRFPEENPYPVFRVDADGTLVYANPACENLLADLDGQPGRSLPEQWLDLIWSALDSQTIEKAEYQHGDRVFAFRAVPVNNASYVNVYSVDTTEQRQAEKTLKETTAILQAAMDCSTAGIAIADAPDGKLRYVNEAGLGIRGSEKKEIVDGIGIDHYVESWQILHFDGTPYADEEVPLARAIMHGETCDSQFIIRRPDNEDRIVWANASPILDEHGKVIAGVVVFPDITERKRAEQKVSENRAQLKSLASELVVAEERERSRLAVHLHDDVCQNLAYAKMKLQVTNTVLSDQARMEGITEVCNTLTQLMQDVRTLTFELSSPLLIEFGLEAAISEWLAEQIEQKHGIDTEFTDDGQAKPLEEDVQALLFRSVRELLVNVVKHSKAKRVEVSICRKEDQILIRLEDDGIGFAPDKVVIGKDTGGFGLFSIRERLSHMRGSLEIDSSPGRGCRSVLRAPLQQS